MQDWANTNILQKPKTFVSDWIVKYKSELIRRQKVEMPTLPEAPMSYDEAQKYLDAVNTFLANEPDAVEVAEVNKHRLEIRADVEQIDNWFQPVVKIEALSDEVTLDMLLQLLPLLKDSPATSVQPTQQQRNRRLQAQRTLHEKIETLIATEANYSESLLTIEACNLYKDEMLAIINQINASNVLPLRLVDTLQNALRIAEQKLVAIKEQNVIEEIQLLYSKLNNDATQQDYIRIRSEIETLA